MEKRVTRKKKKETNKALVIAGRVGIVLGITVLALVLGLYLMLLICCKGPSKSAQNLFVSTFLETGALKFVPSLYFSEKEIEEIVGSNSRGQIDDDVDPGLIEIPSDGDNDNDNNNDNEYNDNFDENGIQIIEVSGLTFSGKLMVVKDPSKVCVGTIYPWSDDNKSKYGVTLDELVKNSGAIAGINGGEYESAGNWGGKPKGLVVCNGEIQYNKIERGDVMVGFNNDNILVIKDLTGMSKTQVESMVKEDGIRDAVSFKDVADGSNDNHFTKLIINGEPIKFTGNGSGANPRTVVGQRKDGAVLLLVTDGRGHNGHVGATAADLISVMQEYGAVNAANIDGGSSSAMYYNGEWEMTSVTLYFSTSSWKLPTGFVVK